MMMKESSSNPFFSNNNSTLISTAPWLQVVENYLDARIFTAVLATINPGNQFNENDLTVPLPDFIFHSDSRSSVVDSEELERRQHNFPLTARSRTISRRRIKTSSSSRGDRETSATKVTRDNRNSTPTSTSGSIEDLIEQDIEKERRRLRSVDQQIKRDSILGKYQNETSQIITTIPTANTIATQMYTTADTTRKHCSLGVNTEAGVKHVTGVNRTRRKKKSDFVFSNPHNIYIPSEYDYVLFDDMEFNSGSTLKLTSGRKGFVSSTRKHVDMYDEDEFMFASDASAPSSSSFISNSDHENQFEQEQEHQQQQQSRRRNKYQSSVYRHVFTPKVVPVKSESKDNMKKILLNQFELTAALHDQLSELNKKKKPKMNCKHAKK